MAAMRIPNDMRVSLLSDDAHRPDLTVPRNLFDLYQKALEGYPLICGKPPERTSLFQLQKDFHEDLLEQALKAIRIFANQFPKARALIKNPPSSSLKDMKTIVEAVASETQTWDSFKPFLETLYYFDETHHLGVFVLTLNYLGMREAFLNEPDLYSRYLGKILHVHAGKGHAKIVERILEFTARYEKLPLIFEPLQAAFEHASAKGQEAVISTISQFIEAHEELQEKEGADPKRDEALEEMLRSGDLQVDFKNPSPAFLLLFKETFILACRDNYLPSIHKLLSFIETHPDMLAGIKRNAGAIFQEDQIRASCVREGKVEIVAALDAFIQKHGLNVM